MLRIGYGRRAATADPDPRIARTRERCVVTAGIDRHFRIIGCRGKMHLRWVKEEKTKPIAVARRIARGSTIAYLAIGIPIDKFASVVVPDNQHPMIWKWSPGTWIVAASLVGAPSALSCAQAA